MNLFEPLPITLDEMIRCAQREIGKRLQVYPRLVDNGTMKQAQADHEVAAMRAIHNTLKNIKENPHVQS